MTSFSAFHFNLLIVFSILITNIKCQLINGTCYAQYMTRNNLVMNGDFQNPPFTTFLQSFPGTVPGWVSDASQQGVGTVYNLNWKTQVIQLDVRVNTIYRQNLTLTIGTKYRFQIQCGANSYHPLSTSGFQILINNQVVIIDYPPADTVIKRYFYQWIATSIINQVSLQGLGTDDMWGQTCDNVQVMQMKQGAGQWITLINGTCQCGLGYFSQIYNGTQVCIPCSAKQNCLLCTTTSILADQYLLTCTRCQNDYILVAGDCQYCSTFIIGCLDCVVGTCGNCDTGLGWQAVNGTCQCGTGTYYNVSKRVPLCQPCSVLHSKCLLCNSFLNVTSQTQYSCKKCMDGFFTSGQNCLPCQNNLIGCLNCSQNGQICYQCNETNQYFLDSYDPSVINPTVCTLCNLTECLDCVSLYKCNKCDDNLGYYLNSTDYLCYKREDQVIQKNVDNINAEKVQHKIIQYSNYVVAALALLSCKIVGLQLYATIQLSFIILADYENTPFPLPPILKWKSINGFNFNPQFFRKQQNAFRTSLQIQKMQYSQYFYENINVMGLLLIAVFVIGWIFKSLSKCLSFMEKIGEILLKQIFITALLFNSFNIGFCIGLHFKYANPADYKNCLFSSMSLFSTLCLSFYGLISLIFYPHKHHGQYIQKFKQSLSPRLYIPLLILYRIILAFFISYYNDKNYITTILIAINLSLLVYTLSNLPFIETRHNYRSNICLLVQLAILIVANYYNVFLHKQRSSQEVIKEVSAAYFELGVIIFAIVVSVLSLTWEICKKVYVFIKKILNDKPNGQKIKPNNVIQPTQSHFKDENYS